MKMTFRRKNAYYISEAIKSINRNGFLSLATVVTVTVSLLILGAVALAVLNASAYLGELESEVEISAFVNRTYSDEDARNLEGAIRMLDGVEDVTFVSRQEAMESMQMRYSDSGYDLERTLDSNPLPNSYRIKVTEPHLVAEVARMLTAMDAIYRVKYGQEIIEKLFSITKGVRWVGLAVIGMTIIGAIFLIGINIRLSIFARRREIYLMQLIGARNSFISRPFYIEGIFLAVLGAVIAVAVLFTGYEFIVHEWSLTSYVRMFPLLTDLHILAPCYGALLVVGLFLGWIGTAISVHRFMTEQ